MDLRDGNEQGIFFILVESNRQILIPFEGDTPQEKIDFQKVIQPKELVSKNLVFIKTKLGQETQLPLLNRDGDWNGRRVMF